MTLAQITCRRPAGAVWFAALAFLMSVAPCWTATARKGDVKKISVAPTGEWVDTGLDLGANARVRVTASGQVQYPDSQSTGPDGLNRGWKDILRVMPVNSEGRGALIGRVGNGDFAPPFLIGTTREFAAGVAGRLYLSVNQSGNDSGSGSFAATIEVLDAGGNSAAAANVAIDKLPTVSELEGITARTLANLPRRVSDQQGNVGDVVNFLIAGAGQDVLKAFMGAGWVQVDKTTKDAILHGLLATLSKDEYTQMPMSVLYLFGRPQDYGLAHAEPFTVVATRNHLRLWKAPMKVNGQELWAGAATHDIGFERDDRNGGVTHKIDPNIDLERTYVGETLFATGMVKKIAYMVPPNPVKEAKTATGGSFHSDGRVLVMSLGSSAQAGNSRGVEFANLFCSVMGTEKPDSGEFGPCATYLETAATSKVPLGTIPTAYRVLIVPGVLSLCASSAPAFQQGQEHLRQKHGVTVDLLPVPNASSESNGRLIAEYLKKQHTPGSKKFIVIGYSKGAPDVQEALAHDGEAASAVVAMVTVAGAVGGSPIADVMPLAAKRWIDAMHMGSCQGDLTAAFQSLSRDARRKFLADYPAPPVPSYSLAAVSDATNTSKVLKQAWQLLQVFGTREDSQLLVEDTLAPGAVDLGAARADHFAIALPFEFLNVPDMQSLVDHNHFPRTALLEALVRLVTADLEGKAGAGAKR